MRFLKSVFDFYLNSSIHVAMAVCGFVGITILEFDFSISNNLLGFIFFGTITGYNFVKYAEVARLKHRRLNLTLRTIQIFSFFSFLALCYFALKLPFNTLLVTGGFAALTFFYAIPVLQHKNLRTLTGIKIVIVALVWAGVTLIIPLVNENEILTNTMWISFIQRAIFVFALTLPFEIRDLKYDELALGTLPQRVGVKSTKYIGTALLIVVILLEFFKPELNWSYLSSLVFISGVLTFFLFISERNQSKYFASFWVESIPVVWFGILLILMLI